MHYPSASANPAERPTRPGTSPSWLPGRPAEEPDASAPRIQLPRKEGAFGALRYDATADLPRPPAPRPRRLPTVRTATLPCPDGGAGRLRSPLRPTAVHARAVQRPGALDGAGRQMPTSVQETRHSPMFGVDELIPRDRLTLNRATY